MVAIGTGERDKPALYADISDAETFAIGRMTTSWAMLEHQMLVTTLCLAEKFDHPIDNAIASFSFDKRFALLRELGNRLTNPRRKAFFDAIVSRIANIQSERQDLTHGLWDWEYSNPGKIKLQAHPRRKAKHKKNYDHERILAIARKIGEINFDLQYPLGMKQWLRERAKGGNYFSRKFLASIQPTRPSDPTLDVFRDLMETNALPILPQVRPHSGKATTDRGTGGSGKKRQSYED
jgi:hypothetical protein